MHSRQALIRILRRILGFSVLALFFILLPDVLFPSPPTVILSDLQPLSLTGYHRLLIMAPHCDDETLGPAGLILAAQRAGIDIRVVIATNGDGYIFATMEDFHKIFLRAKDFIRFGEKRQQESLAALSILNVHPTQVYFLGYPDGGTNALWNKFWSALHPYRSPYSQSTHSPYPITFNPSSVYAGEDYLSDIETIIDSYRPDIIVYPHPNDIHPDHWGMNGFTRLAVAMIEHTDPEYNPTQYTYLVHRPDFPIIRGLKPDEVLVPPPMLYMVNPDWLRWDLSPDDVISKKQAVEQYRTQRTRLNGLLDAFIRVDEPFSEVMNVKLPVIANGDPLDPDTWEDENGKPIEPVQLDPIEDYIVRDYIASSDIKMVYASGDKDGRLNLCAQLRYKTTPQLTYNLRIKALTDGSVTSFSAKTGRSSGSWQTANHSGNFVCSTFSLLEMGPPWAIFVEADVEAAGRVMDETAWQLVYPVNP